jgi:hypothetical protein
MENLIRFNMNAIKMTWNPFLSFGQPMLENKH